MVPPTPTDTPSAIAAAKHAVNTHTQTQEHTHTQMQTHLISNEMLSRRIRSAPVKLAVWTGERRAQTDRQGGQMSQKRHGVITSQHSLRSHFTSLQRVFISDESFKVSALPLKFSSIKTNRRGSKSLRHLTSEFLLRGGKVWGASQLCLIDIMQLHNAILQSATCNLEKVERTFSWNTGSSFVINL